MTSPNPLSALTDRQRIEMLELITSKLNEAMAAMDKELQEMRKQIAILDSRTALRFHDEA